ncbi:MAG: hypothetical protein M3Q08_09240 [Pseudomonadota bacterium]|nr:hypothetical protein [Pseudomonadota bacterium]
MTAIQAIDFHALLTTSTRLDGIVREVRAQVPHYSADRYFADELQWAKEQVLAGSLCFDFVETLS